ncbi:MAG: efflux RND transporter periplasmic adaptor subunit [Planctomycetes bacterium]|nr:efflux RND transporter periplasmic adaptor subunit [Planctomycetota bacterium]
MTLAMPYPRRIRLRLLAVGALPLLFGACSGEANEPGANARLFRVERADLPITVKENAELQAVRETVVRSEVEGQSTVIFLIPEGTNVQQGEKLVELDVSELVEKRANQAIAVAKAEAALAQAQKEKEILQKELTTRENTARSGLRIAEMEVDKFRGRRGGGGEGKNADMLKKLEELVTTPPSAPPEPTAGEPVAEALVSQVDPRNYRGLTGKVRELLSEKDRPNGGLDRDMGDMANKVLRQVDAIRLAMAELKVKEDTLGHSRRLAAKQFITRNELERDQLEWQSQVSQVTLAWNELDLLINYELEKQRIELQQESENATLELERVLASNDAEVTKADSELTSRQAEFTLAKERLDNLERQIRSAVVHAPTPGLVVYARIDRDRRGGEAVREGVQVRERQELIVLPDTTRMRCIIKVQEAQVSMVRPGQIAYVQAEARPGEVYQGRVTSVAPTADSNSGWMSSDRKVYTTVVDLDGENSDAKLRSRMAASVTINIEKIADTLPVPLQGIYRDRNVNYVWKQTDQGPVATRVEVGRHNSEMVEVLRGLAVGDVIHLAVPVGAQPPQFEQPALPEIVPAPTAAAPPAEPATPGAQNGGGNRGPGTANRGPGGGPRKKFTEMTPEELQQSRDQLAGMPDMMRARLDAEQVDKLERAVADIVKAIDEKRLEDAQTLRDGLRSLMPRRNNGGGSGGGQGPGGGGTPERNANGG